MAVPSYSEHPDLPGVYLVELSPKGDNRGRFSEIFRKEWFPQRSWHAVQINRSDSRAGVLRGLHYHFNQVDYWYLAAGTIRVGLVELRPDQARYRASAALTLSADDHTGLYIPSGVAHGFYAVTDVTLFYVVDNYYDGGDEYGLAWNDPDVTVDWQVDGLPELSGRDSANPLLRDIPAADLPRV